MNFDRASAGLHVYCFIQHSADCGTLHDPTNGKVDTSMGTCLESLATYTCDEGYELSHTGERVCLSSGQWSGTAPTCEPAGEPAGELWIWLYL